MQKWEHGILYPPVADEVLYPPIGERGWHFVSQSRGYEIGGKQHSRLEMLNKLGLEGWELAGIGHVLELVEAYYFKRPLG